MKPSRKFISEQNMKRKHLNYVNIPHKKNRKTGRLIITSTQVGRKGGKEWSRGV